MSLVLQYLPPRVLVFFSAKKRRQCFFVCLFLFLAALAPPASAAASLHAQQHPVRLRPVARPVKHLQ
jgi:hypothetical protein